MQVALLPAVPPDVKRAAEEALINRLGSISSGERSTCQAKFRPRGCGAADGQRERIMQAALSNPQMTEIFVVRR